MRIGLIIALAAGLAFCSLAQPAPAPAATAPARYEMVMPAGFEKVAVGSHVAICKPLDLEWVKKGLAELKPATRPSTMPVDVLKRTTQNRAEVVKQMVADLGLADDKDVNALFDEKILPSLKKLDELKPPVIYLITTRDQLRLLCKDGWGEPRFHYNRVANEVSVSKNVMLSLDRPMDDSVLPFFYEEKDTPETRMKNLGGDVQKLDSELAGMISGEAEPTVFKLLADHIAAKCLDVSKQPRDQQWFALGATGYFSAKYAGSLTLASKEQWLKVMTYEDPRFPVSSKIIDLTKPQDPSSMKPGAVPYYEQAMRRKAVRVVMQWAEKSGEGSVTKALLAARAKPPADGAGLVKLIFEICGVDLGKEVGPG